MSAPDEGYKGWIPDDFDPRDYHYNSSIPTKYWVDLWSDIETRSCSVKVYNQYWSNSCVANAAAACYWYEEKKALKDKETLSPDGPSRLFIYWNARARWLRPGQNPMDNGSQNRATMDSLHKFGVALENQSGWPWDMNAINTPPPEAAYDQAKAHKIDAYYRLDPKGPGQLDSKSNEEKEAIGALVLMNLKRCLSEGYPVLFAFKYYWPASAGWSGVGGTIEQFKQVDGAYAFGNTNRVMTNLWKEGLQYNHKADGKLWQRHTYPNYSSSQGEAHVVLAIGYREDQKLVLVQNSWGLGHENADHFWMPYDWITDFAATSDFWTIRSSAPTTFTPLKWDEMHALVQENMKADMAAPKEL